MMNFSFDQTYTAKICLTSEIQTDLCWVLTPSALPRTGSLTRIANRRMHKAPRGGVTYWKIH